jgi:hypothetical protein
MILTISIIKFISYRKESFYILCGNILKERQLLFHYPPEAYGKWSTARFREVGGAL